MSAVLLWGQYQGNIPVERHSVDWPQFVVAILALAVALTAIIIIHKLVTPHGYNQLFSLEVVAFTLVGAGILLDHVANLSRSLSHPDARMNFGSARSDAFLVFCSLAASFLIYLVAKSLDSRHNDRD
jgi:uncharacterized membrane protein YjfL (UPF0719 family)